MMRIREVAEVDHRSGARAELDIGDRAFTTLDAIQPVAMMARRYGQVHVLLAERFADQFRGVALQNTPVDAQGSVLAVEDTATRATMLDFGTIGVEVPNAGGGLWIGWRNDFHRAGLVHAECPVCDVVVVCTHVSVPATGILPVAAPSGKMIVDAAWAENRMVGAGWRLAKPHVPRQSCFQRFSGKVTGNTGSTDAHGDAVDGSEATAADNLDSLTEFAEYVGALLAPGLDDALELAGSFDATLRFGDRQG